MSSTEVPKPLPEAQRVFSDEKFWKLIPRLVKLSYGQFIMIQFRTEPVKLVKPAFVVFDRTLGARNYWKLVIPTVIEGFGIKHPWTLGYEQGPSKIKKFLFPIITTRGKIFSEKVTSSQDLERIKKSLGKNCAKGIPDQAATLFSEASPQIKDHEA
jgi:hypothetical protein